MTPSPVPSLIPIAADLSGHQVQSRAGGAGPKDAAGALDGFWWPRTIPAAGSGSRLFRPFLKHPGRGVTFHGSAAVRAYSQQGPGGPYR
jgi:hypothetical protein